MNEFNMQKSHQDSDKRQQQRGIKNQLGKTMKGSKGSYSSEYAQLNYRDPDLKRLAEEGKGTTSSYQYS